MPNKKQHRLFFALWPDAAVRRQIVKTLEQSQVAYPQGRRMSPSNIHMTLHFIGNVTAERMDCMHEAALAVRANGFDLVLDRIGYFNKARVLWMGTKKPPQALEILYRSLGDVLTGCDYLTDNNRSFTPHVTLMRKLIKTGELAVVTPVQWQIRDFVLVESIAIERGVRYKVLQHYPLNKLRV